MTQTTAVTQTRQSAEDVYLFFSCPWCPYSPFAVYVDYTTQNMAI